jgi:hypothetical protein
MVIGVPIMVREGNLVLGPYRFLLSVKVPGIAPRTTTLDIP